MDEKIKTKTSQGVSAGSHPFMKTSQILIYLFCSPSISFSLLHTHTHTHTHTHSPLSTRVLAFINPLELYTIKVLQQPCCIPPEISSHPPITIVKYSNLRLNDHKGSISLSNIKGKGVKGTD